MEVLNTIFYDDISKIIMEYKLLLEELDYAYITTYIPEEYQNDNLVLGIFRDKNKALNSIIKNLKKTYPDCSDKYSKAFIHSVEKLKTVNKLECDEIDFDTKVGYASYIKKVYIGENHKVFIVSGYKDGSQNLSFNLFKKEKGCIKYIAKQTKNKQEFVKSQLDEYKWFDEKNGRLWRIGSFKLDY